MSRRSSNKGNRTLLLEPNQLNKRIANDYFHPLIDTNIRKSSINEQPENKFSC